MNHEQRQLTETWEERGVQSESVLLYEGIVLSYIRAAADSFSLCRGAAAEVVQIHCCRGGQAVWAMENGNHMYLNPGDISLHTLHGRGDSAFRLPTGQYQGLSVTINTAAAHPPELLGDVLPGGLQNLFPPDGGALFLPGTPQTETILAGFYDQPPALRLPYQRLKTLELLLYLLRMERPPQTGPSEYPADQIRTVRAVHDYLLRHMERRITIEELSKQYHINPTTLKAAFKAVYGTSLAAHIKEHRMEQAAKLLRETDLCIAEIAQAVGYDSQSRFTAAFKEVYGLLPSLYRRQNRG